MLCAGLISQLLHILRAGGHAWIGIEPVRVRRKSKKVAGAGKSFKFAAGGARSNYRDDSIPINSLSALGETANERSHGLGGVQLAGTCKISPRFVHNKDNIRSRGIAGQVAGILLRDLFYFLCAVALRLGRAGKAVHRGEIYKEPIAGLSCFRIPHSGLETISKKEIARTKRLHTQKADKQAECACE